MHKKGIVLLLLLMMALNGVFAVAEELFPTRRFGIFVGANNGGRGRAMLRYAVSDARSVSKVFSGMGGIAAEDNIVMVEPTIAEINRRIDQVGRTSAQAKRNTQRTELVFYYSGHSDENGIFLNRERYGYRELRDRINAVQADMRIVILDSCSSGAITRAKGGVKTQPFLFDSSVSAEGYAILTSSSATETSMESDSIESSYFTHNLLTGLRGAADSVGDGRVTLLELYRFAYTETLAMTETSVFGAQHPSYDIQISGSGDVVLTDINEISASIIISEELTGRFSIRDGFDFLIAELTKVGNKALELGLEPGMYTITLQQGDNFFRAEIVIPENKRITLGMKDFTMIAAAPASRVRGNEAVEEDIPLQPVNFQFIPGYNIFGTNDKKTTNNILIGVFLGNGYNLSGVGVASIGLINSGYVRGIQSSGIFNIAESSVQGIQAAGTFNIARADVHGIQASGIFNTAGGNVHGIQATGIVNTADGDVRGIQASGIFNAASGYVHGIQATGIFNTAGGGVQGIQATGIYNYAGSLKGAQAGLVNKNKGGSGAMFGVVNISESEDMVPFGVVNVIKNGILHPALYVDDMLFSNFSFRSGSKHFYSIMGIGVKADNLSDDRDNFMVSRVGVGFEIPIKKLFINFDSTSGTIFNLSKTGYYIDRGIDHAAAAGAAYKASEKYAHDYETFHTLIQQVRLTVGYKIFKHLGFFGGLSYDHLFRAQEYSFNASEDISGSLIGGIYDRHTHKLGFFGGIQF